MKTLEQLLCPLVLVSAPLSKQKQLSGGKIYLGLQAQVFPAHVQLLH